MTIPLISKDEKKYQVPRVSIDDESKHSHVVTDLIPKYKLDQIISNCIEKLSSLDPSSPMPMTKSQDDNQTLEYSYDLLIENERGLIIFGLPFYTKYMLPFDPPNFTNSRGSRINNLKLFPLPDLNWRWTWSKWYVIMNDDNDDQGWSYNWKFGSKNWRGEQKLGCFVRRRIWLRLREKVAEQ